MIDGFEIYLFLGGHWGGKVFRSSGNGPMLDRECLFKGIRDINGSLSDYQGVAYLSQDLESLYMVMDARSTLFISQSEQERLSADADRRMRS